MDNIDNAYDTEMTSMKIFIWIALTCFMIGNFIRWHNKENPTKPLSYGCFFWFGAMFLVMGFLPVGLKSWDLNRTPKEVLQGEILEVNSVGDSQLLRISTSDNRVIKVVRSQESRWPATPGPVQVEFFHHHGREFVSKVKRQPDA